MVCKSATLEDARAVIILMAENVHLHQVWGILDLGYLFLILLRAMWTQSRGPRRPVSGGKATAQRWYCWNSAGRDGSSGIPNPAGEQNCHLVNHKMIFVLARRTLSIWKIQTVFTT